MIEILLAAWLVADLFSGLFHWWEDRYGDPSWPIVGKYIVQPNVRHHEEQTAFLAGDVWTRNWTTMLPCLAAGFVCYATEQHFLQIVFGMLAFSNEVHAWSHQKCSRPIRGLQMFGLLHSPEQHAEHHKRPFDRRYCVMTDWTNQYLEVIDFWGTLEEGVFLVTGIEPRKEREQA